MAGSEEFKRILGEALKEAFYASMERGFLGEPIGNGRYQFESLTRAGRWRVRLMRNDQIYSIVDAINFKVPRRPDIRVLVDKNADGDWEVIGPDPRWIVESLNNLPGAGIGPHSHRRGFGLEDMVEQARFEPGLVVWHSASLNVRVYPFFHRHEGIDQFIPESQVSVAAAVPVAAASWAWGKVVYNPVTLSLSVIAGPSVASAALLTEASLAAIAAPNLVPLGGVKLKTGQTQITDGKDFLDCRAFLGGDGGGSAISGVPVTVCGEAVWCNGEQVFYTA